MSKTWTALTTLSEKSAAEALGRALEGLDTAPTGVGVFEVEDGSGVWEVGAYFTEAPDDIALALLAAVHGAAAFAVSEVPETDWVAHVRRELPPVEAGRFFVYGAHDADRVPPGRVALRIEAAMAFGTGHHGTTLGCLTMLDRLAGDGIEAKRVVDIGCGTAVLAMGASAIWPSAMVLATDIDPVAVEVAQTNLTANGYDAIRCFEATGFDHPDLCDGGFDLVLANILKGPLLSLAEAMANATAPNGHAILSGILTHQADEVAQCYRRFGFNMRDRLDIVDWSTLCLHRQV